MTTKLLLEFAFVIFILQAMKIKSYFTPLEIRQQKYDNGRFELDKLLGKTMTNRLVIICSVVFTIIYISFYLVGFKLFIGTKLIVFPIFLTITSIYGLIDTILDVNKDKLTENIMNRISQPVNTAYLIYFVWYVVKHNSVI